jgi:hypothetical protein
VSIHSDGHSQSGQRQPIVFEIKPALERSTVAPLAFPEHPAMQR